jgi:cyanophycinase
MSCWLYLAGGSEVLSEVARDLEARRVRRLLVLFSDPRSWKKAWPDYTRPFSAVGITDLVPFSPPSRSLDAACEALSAALDRSDGVVIGGGFTPRYQKVYGRERLVSLIQRTCDSGVPVIGISAGALLAPRYCVLYPEETHKERCEVRGGLGLLRDQLVGVAFTERGGRFGPAAGMAMTGISAGWALDKTGCAVFENSTYKYSLGTGIYRIEVSPLLHAPGT